MSTPVEAEKKEVPKGTPFPKGVSGNPSGKAKTKIITDQVRMLLAEDRNRARNIANKLLEQAEAGCIKSIRELWQRLEGKVPQELKVQSEVAHLDRIDREERILRLQARMVMSAALRSADVEEAEIVEETDDKFDGDPEPAGA